MSKLQRSQATVHSPGESCRIPEFFEFMEKAISHSPTLEQFKTHTHTQLNISLSPSSFCIHKKKRTERTAKFKGKVPLENLDTYKVHGGAFEPSTHLGGPFAVVWRSTKIRKCSV